jgi:hypothetical protein
LIVSPSVTHASKAIEIEDLDRRPSDLERATEAAKDGASGKGECVNLQTGLSGRLTALAGLVE